ncbi:hypothetical protein T265_14186, partial [Opisthorchis viverrini]
CVCWSCTQELVECIVPSKVNISVVSQLDFQVVAAIDINDTANRVYRANFSHTHAPNRVLESLSIEEVTSFTADMWSMSPPCQPFTRLGNQKYEEDNRSTSFFYVLGLIAAIRPKFILLENVKGFEHTEPWRQFLKVLHNCGYRYQQFLLTPLQFGVPNCRLRYYLVASSSSDSASSGLFAPHVHDSSHANTIHIVPPADLPPLPGCECPVCLGHVNHITKPDENFDEYLPYCRPISDYLTQHQQHSNLDFLDDSCLRRYFHVLDIVRPCDHKSRCFTKGYQKRIEGTGSVLQTATDPLTGEEINAQWITARSDPETQMSLAKRLQLRFFHSREVANLLCFPQTYTFPEDVTEKQRIRLLGNSVNVLVVAHLIHWAFGGFSAQKTD